MIVFKKAMLLIYNRYQLIFNTSVLSLCIVIALILYSLSLNAASTSNEYYVKAAYVRKIIDFIGWPETSFQTKESPIVLCMIGVENFPRSFYGLNGTIIGKRKLTIIRYNVNYARRNNIRNCHILYLGEASQPSSQELIMMAIEQGIVTISDMKNFIYDQGMIGLVVDTQHIGIEINLFVAQMAGIRIRAQLVEVAKTVIKNDLGLE